MFETVYFAAGCFWGVEQYFSQILGVTGTEVGYIGGTLVAPNYEDVKSGNTGHAEAVRIQFDPARISFDRLLEHFFKCHDPTQMDRQGPDFGTQYRSHIFCSNDEQEKVARKALGQLIESKAFSETIKTRVSGAGDPWYPAESWHQKYFQKNPGQCHLS